jgi:LPS sulfotransferase NodH
MIEEIFDPEADQKRYEFWTRAQAPTKVYSILFTPRSGSSWLTSILTKTRSMGTPGEWFNPALMPSSTRSKGARNLDQFIEAISRHEAYGNIFGFEITYHQLKAVFRSEMDFMSRFQDALFFWLTREDIVAQGVSLDKMVRTKVSHAAYNDVGEIEHSDSSYDYDARCIQKWIRHIHEAEIGTEKMIAEFGLSPVRLSYEAITSAGAQDTVSLFAEKLGLDNFVSRDIPSEHRKIGTSKNDEFSERFRSENQEFMDKINSERAEMISHYD